MLVCSCANNKKLSKANLTSAEHLIFKNNWDVAQDIAEYDFYSWIASDSLMRYHDKINEEAIEGYVVIFDDSGPRVVFGNTIENSLQKYFDVTFTDDKINCELYVNGKKESKKANTLFWAINKAKEINHEYLMSENIPYNSYAFVKGDSTIVYLSPGSTNDYLILCGGLKTTFNKKKLIENVKLHKSPMVVEYKPNMAYIIRTSGNNDIPNEVDIAQFLILKEWIPIHLIITTKYNFTFVFDQKSNNISYEVMIKK